VVNRNPVDTATRSIRIPEREREREGRFLKGCKGTSTHFRNSSVERKSKPPHLPRTSPSTHLPSSPPHRSSYLPSHPTHHHLYSPHLPTQPLPPDSSNRSCINPSHRTSHLGPSKCIPQNTDLHHVVEIRGCFPGFVVVSEWELVRMVDVSEFECKVKGRLLWV